MVNPPGSCDAIPDGCWRMSCSVRRLAATKRFAGLVLGPGRIALVDRDGSLRFECPGSDLTVGLQGK